MTKKAQIINRERARVSGTPLGFETQLWDGANALRLPARGAQAGSTQTGLPVRAGNARTGKGAHGGRIGDISIYGQCRGSIPPPYTTWRLAMMNLAIRGIDGRIDLPAAPLRVAAQAGNQSGEGEIRKNIIEADLVDCMVALPGQLFYSTQISACLWFLARDKKNGPACRAERGAGRRFRDRRGQVLFIFMDVRRMGRMADGTYRTLNDDVTLRQGRSHAAKQTEQAEPML